MDTRKVWLGTGLVISGAALVLTSSGLASASPSHSQVDGGSYVATPIISDQPGVAPVTDPHLVNPWGISFGPTTPLWVSNNGTSTSTLYTTNNGPAQTPLVVTTQPGPTGTVFNDTTEFALPNGAPSNFLFDSVSGQLSAWGGGTQTTTTASASGAVFTGLALAHTDNGPRLYAADAATTNVLVYNGKWQQDSILTDRHLPAGPTTYNVAVIGKNVYVSYAPPPGVDSKVQGVIDVFNFHGQLERRLVTGGVLQDPWGMVVAPHTWGKFADALLVGNRGAVRSTRSTRTPAGSWASCETRVGSRSARTACGAWRSATASSALPTTWSSRSVATSTSTASSNSFTRRRAADVGAGRAPLRGARPAR
jgi:uncharacterized protein (TIGR03118 family)